jgi:hypothetical protein
MGGHLSYTPGSPDLDGILLFIHCHLSGLFTIPEGTVRQAMISTVIVAAALSPITERRKIFCPIVVFNTAFPGKV